MSATFYAGSDWRRSSNLGLRVNAILTDLWPQGAPKDVLEDGLHPVLAIGPATAADGRPQNIVGVVVTYDSTGDRAVMDIAPGTIVRQVVANVLTYAASVPDTFETSLTFAYPVYVDDSDDLATGVTLSLSPLNDAGLSNPLAGFAWRQAGDEPDTGIGGGNTDPYPITIANSLTNTTLDVLLIGFNN